MRKIFFIGILALAAASGGVARGRSVEAITRPSGDVTLSFTLAGRIAAVTVKSGQAVKKGQVVSRQDDSEDVAKIKLAAEQAHSPIKVEAAVDELKQKQTDLAKLQTAAKDNAVTVYEVEHAKLAVAIADLAVQLAQFNHAQRKLQLGVDEIQLQHKRLTSPINGVVEKVYVHDGEAVNALDKVIRVVQINPLWVHVPVPLADAAKLKLGEAVRVQFPGGVAKRGKIVRIARVADAASNTLAVRVKVKNNAGRPAGEHVRIALPGTKSVAVGR